MARDHNKHAPAANTTEFFMNDPSAAKCPFLEGQAQQAAGGGTRNRD